MLLLASLASADIIQDAPSGQIHINHVLRIEGLEAHPDVVLLALEEGAEGALHAYRTYTAENNQRELATGASRRQGMATASFHLMTQADYEAWEKATSEDVERQRKLCEEGIGCVHESRFEPTMKAPTTRTSCGLEVSTQVSAPTGSPETRTDVYKIVEASATACSLEPVSVEVAKPAVPVPTPGCSHLNLVSGALGGLLLLLGVRRRAQ